jgi:hypothetical protein
VDPGLTPRPTGRSVVVHGKGGDHKLWRMVARAELGSNLGRRQLQEQACPEDEGETRLLSHVAEQRRA